MIKSSGSGWQKSVQGSKPLRKRSRARIEKDNREREETAQAAGPAKAARTSARTPTPPPPQETVPKGPSYSSRGTTPQPRDRIAMPPKRAAADPRVMSPSMQAEPFVPAGFTSAGFPDVEVAILPMPKEKAKIRLASTSAGKTQSRLRLVLRHLVRLCSRLRLAGNLFLL